MSLFFLFLLVTVVAIAVVVTAVVTAVVAAVVAVGVAGWSVRLVASKYYSDGSSNNIKHEW